MRFLTILIICGLMAGFAIDATAAPAKKDTTGFPLNNLGSANEQIEVTADESLEWHQDSKLYLARGNAKATKGNITIEADLLSAHARQEDKTTPSEDNLAGGTSGIDKLTAEGNVRIYDPRQQIFGDNAVYDFDQKLAKVTGTNLRYVTEKDTVTAKDSLEYYEDKNLAIARGKAVAIHDKSHIEADILTAQFKPNAAGQLELSQMTAEGNVTVITGKDVARGDKAIYNLKSNIAILTGNVKITRDNTQLSGNKAEVNFANGKNRLLNEGKGRVRALLSTKQIKEKSVNTGTKSSAKPLSGAKVNQ